MSAEPFQLRNCAKWHERQARRNPERRAHHERTAVSLREQANRVIRARSTSVNAPKH